MKEFMYQVIRESIEYAKRYNCTVEEALADWEGDGPNGSWGLNKQERARAQYALKQVQKWGERAIWRAKDIEDTIDQGLQATINEIHQKTKSGCSDQFCDILARYIQEYRKESLLNFEAFATE